MEERKIKEQKEKEIWELHDELKAMSQKKEYQIKQIDERNALLKFNFRLMSCYSDEVPSVFGIHFGTTS